MGLCSYCKKNEAVPCIQGWTHPDGSVITDLCYYCETLTHELPESHK